MMKILSDQGLNMLEGERHVGNAVNWNNILLCDSAIR